MQRRFIGMKKVECIVVIVAFVCVACGGSSSQPNVQFDLEKLKSEGYTLVTCDQCKGQGKITVTCEKCHGKGRGKCESCQGKGKRKSLVTVMKSATTATERALLTVKRAMVKERWM